MIDSLLTLAGERQCDKLREDFPFHSSVELVVASPIHRTIYTALHAFAPVFESNPELKLIALPDLQEVSDLPCDSGSDLESLEKEVLENNLPVDLSLVSSGWHVKVSGSSHFPAGNTQHILRLNYTEWALCTGWRSDSSPCP